MSHSHNQPRLKPSPPQPCPKRKRPLRTTTHADLNSPVDSQLPSYLLDRSLRCTSTSRAMYKHPCLALTLLCTAQWALQAQCESNPQLWMLEGAAPKIQHVRNLLAHYIGCEKQDLALVENCTSGANAVLRSLNIPAGSTLLHLSTAYGVIKNCMAHVAEECGANIVEVSTEGCIHQHSSVNNVSQHFSVDQHPRSIQPPQGSTRMLRIYPHFLHLIGPSLEYTRASCV
eukprot:2270347-Pyramimonas_sp.AAC.2